MKAPTSKFRSSRCSPGTRARERSGGEVKVRAGNFDVCCELTGDAGLPVVTFVHGLAASLEIWAGQAERLSDRFRVLRYDLRAHGGTTRAGGAGGPAGACSRHDLAE